jgi:hypothetical protein
MLMKGPDELARKVLSSDVPDTQVMVIVGEPTFEEMEVATGILEESCGSRPDLAILRADTYRVLYERDGEEAPNVMGVPVTMSDLVPRGDTYLVVMSRISGECVDPSGIFRVTVVG